MCLFSCCNILGPTPDRHPSLTPAENQEDDKGDGRKLNLSAQKRYTIRVVALVGLGKKEVNTVLNVHRNYEAY